MSNIDAILKDLTQHAQTMQQTHLNALFANDDRRFEKFHAGHDGIVLDYSKNLISQEGMKLFERLLDALQFSEKRQQLFSGQSINHTEQRPALHMALRADSNDGFPTDVMQSVTQNLQTMRQIANHIAQQDAENPYQIPMPITDIVNIGIGGSHLGPAMAMQALAPFHAPHLRCHFVSNLDGSNLADVLKKLDPKTSLFLISSKSFTTDETRRNAIDARDWVNNGGGSAETQFFAMTANHEAARNFGIGAQNILPLWDWVGGRFSLCSAIGFSLMLAIGDENFTQMLAGARNMDRHFLQQPVSVNLPVLLACMHCWARNFLNMASHAIIPYDHRMRLFPIYLQQLLMESNGKSVNKDGKQVYLKTSPIYWGEVGSNAQHSFFQLLHQGCDPIPVDFLLARHAMNGMPERHDEVMASCLAQSQALMKGYQDSQSAHAPWQYHHGNRPSNIILFPKLTPYYLGALVALYEHMCFTQSVIWQINAFDQFGVDYGKHQSKKMRASMEEMQQQQPLSHQWDSSTLGLLRTIMETKDA